MTDPIARPAHYTRWKIEPIYFIMENGLPFDVGNVIKYAMRWEGKNGVEDLKKARRYLDMMILKAEGETDYAGDPREQNLVDEILRWKEGLARQRVPRQSKEWAVSRNRRGQLVARRVRAGPRSRKPLGRHRP